MKLLRISVSVCVCGLTTHPEPLYPGPCDLLAVIQLNAVEAVTCFEVLQRGVCDERAVIELNHFQSVVSTRPTAQVTDAIVCNQLTMRQTLHPNTHTTQ